MEEDFFSHPVAVTQTQFPWKSTALQVARWTVHHFQQVWRMIVSIVLSLVIYTLFSWLPNIFAMFLAAFLLCAFGQYDVNIVQRRYSNNKNE